MFNIRNYSPEVTNIQRREAELNIILLRVNNFDIKQKGMEYLFYYMPPTSKKICEDKANKTQKISVTTSQSFFVKTELQHIQLQLLVNHFILLLLIFFLK